LSADDVRDLAAELEVSPIVDDDADADWPPHERSPAMLHRVYVRGPEDGDYVLSTVWSTPVRAGVPVVVIPTEGAPFDRALSAAADRLPALLPRRLRLWLARLVVLAIEADAATFR
jgi:hypothetical protein